MHINLRVCVCVCVGGWMYVSMCVHSVNEIKSKKKKKIQNIKTNKTMCIYFPFSLALNFLFETRKNTRWR